MKDEKYLSALSKKKGYRVLAWICLAVTSVLVVITFITGITGSPYYLGCLFLCIVVPVFMYLWLWIGRVLASLHGDRDEHLSDKEESD